MHVSDVRRDLIAEQNALDYVVSSIDSAVFARPTASPGWAVADQIAHLAYFDNAAAVAIANPDAFPAMVSDLLEAAARGDSADEFTLGRYRAMQPTDLLDAWRSDRAALADASAGLADDDRVDWYGPSMGSKSFLTARLMECWAHGQDIAAAAGATIAPTDRLAHIARLGFITRGWTYVNRQLEVPAGDVRVELLAPSGDHWTFGPEDAEDAVTGTALDFCLVVTQRTHVDNTALVATPGARDWLLIAQAFAGPPTIGPSAQS
ncbi:MAG: TIGR03084 family protein [Acidimicrobiales bacterium]|nr:TIGR03084 family protein [Acidimicrobiales bacterium]